MSDVVKTGRRGIRRVRNDERAARAMLVGRERMESVEIRESAGLSDPMRRGATRPCVSSGKRLSGSRSQRGGTVAQRLPTM